MDGCASKDGTRFPPAAVTEGQFRQILNIADDAIVSVDQRHNIILFNQGAERTFGYSVDEAMGESLDLLLPTRFQGPHRKHISDFEEAETPSRRMGERGRIVGRRKDGSEFPAEASISKLSFDELTIYTVILRDITQRFQDEEKIRSSLREKEVLLREIHHRVKNNLQVVSSLLGLQSRGTDDEQVRKHFRESQNRVQAMALIHEKLYQSESFSSVDFPEYLRQLASHLFRSYQVSSSRVVLRTEVADVRLSIDAAVPCGLVLNELLSNALKYAFPDGRDGAVLIRLTEEDDQGVVALTVADDGVGLPPEVGFWNTRTLGLRLVRSLVRQLGGDVEIDRSLGTRITVSFEAQKADKTEPN
jgi:PAS domain S-box-containing protein